jgi:hypothetical protein
MVTTMDDVLDILHRISPEFGGGLANHGPMVADAMLALGRPDAVLISRRRMRAWPPATPGIPPSRLRLRQGAARRLKTLPP